MIHRIQHILIGGCHILEAVGYLFMFVLPPGSFTEIEVYNFFLIEMEGLLFFGKHYWSKYHIYFLPLQEKKMCSKKFE